MNKLKIVLFLFFFSFSGFSFAKNPSSKPQEFECKLTFNLESWSVFYKSGKGNGTIHCDNGKSAHVKIRAHGGGITFGKSKIINGHGTFSKVKSMKELYGSYAEAEGHAGASKSASARALTKGNVSLTLTGTGSGVDLGFNFGSFKISPK